ncbi:NrtA/SsuA/CpmA family ABC transporter substrate-binding protein [Saccharopolyspora phatthalungensis]|uniref:Putative aliphatic sulfonates-binding protein n=1 Tax=Saccharopolyspora phatthalungensis TaxID=664693 RepID=A0A840QKU7_9PSEU|nr:NrtA/SsuA/CpmA family ABC transporter substrate-binding protein [Saccharopolyspora phatthalungensis]MBB5159483.1 sulfonate transport system substrate-binding protein [Saccharopolyspora phatthalungensis]
MSATLSRRRLLGLSGAGAAALVLAACGSSSGGPVGTGTQSAPSALRYAVIGDGRVGIPAALRAKLGGVDLGAALGGVPVTWQPGFTASLPVMEALKAGEIDFTFATATAVIYGVGGKVPLVPLAAFPLPGNEVDILVPKGSPITGAADLRGKRVADQQGTTGTYSLIKYLETAGLTLRDVQYQNLAAADAEAAFANGSVDAWISWQPQIELAKRRHDAVALPGVRTYDYAYFVTSEAFAESHLDTAVQAVKVVRDAQNWLNANPDAAVQAFAAAGGFGNDQLTQQVYRDLIVARRLSESLAGPRLGPVADAAAASTQELADNFHALGVYPQQIAVRDWLTDSRFGHVKKAVSDVLA